MFLIPRRERVTLRFDRVLATNLSLLVFGLQLAPARLFEHFSRRVLRGFLCFVKAGGTGRIVPLVGSRAVRAFRDGSVIGFILRHMG